MKKYLFIMFVAFSAMAFAQFQDNVFEKDKTATHSNVQETDGVTAKDSQSSLDTFPDEGSQAGKPGNPGPAPAPIDDYLPMLLIGGLSLIIYFQRKNKKINI